MITMNELVDLRMQQHIAHEIYRQQIMQRIPDPFPPMLPIPMPRHVIMPPRVTLPGVEATLQNDDLWKQFHQIGTEMIITKSGRRMFPSMRLSLAGLEDDSNYCVLLEMVPIGDCRYKFSGSQWVPAGGAEPQSPQRMYLHPDSPATGAHWQAQPILFNKVKLTNNTLDNNGHIVLASMHKYQPRLHVIRTADLTQIPWAPQQAFVFSETEFVAVTAYQNDRITKLKIDNNPFAKGFRETGQSRCKRKMSSSPSHEDQQQQQRINQQQQPDHNDQRASSNSNNNNNNMSPMSPSLNASSSAICSSDKTATSLSQQRLLNDYEDAPRIKRMRSNGSACSIASFDEVVVDAGASVTGGGGPDLSSSNSMSSGQSSPNAIAANNMSVHKSRASSGHLEVGCAKTTASTASSSTAFMHHFQQNMQSLLRPSLVDLACSYFGRPPPPVYAPLQHMYNNVTFGVGREMHDVGLAAAGMGLASGAAAVLPIQLPEHLAAPLAVEVPGMVSGSSALSPMPVRVSIASEQLNTTETPASRQTTPVRQKKGFSISAILDGSS